MTGMSNARTEPAMPWPRLGGAGAAPAVVHAGACDAAESAAALRLQRALTDQSTLVDRLREPYLQMTARPGAVPRARHHARKMLWGWGLKELAEPVELVVSEVVTNAVRTSGGLDGRRGSGGGGAPVVRLWLAAEETAVLVLVWDASPSLPQRQEPDEEAESGRGLLLVESVSAGWGSFVPDGWPGKVVWALCRI